MSDLLLLVPFLAIVVSNLLPRSARGAAFGICFATLAAQTVVAILHPFGLLDWSFLTPMVQAIGFDLMVDNLTILPVLSAGIAGIAALLVGQSTLRDPGQRFLFANLLLIALIGINGIAMAIDLFALYVFVEVTAIGSFILVTLGRGPDAFEGAWKYVILSAVASVLMLSSVALFLLSTGGISFDDVRAAVSSPTPVAWVALVLYLCGLFIKGAIVPFHGWLADAYTAAPAAVSTFLAGIVTKASGIFALLRLVQTAIGQALPARGIFLVAGALTILVGAFLALGQSNMKRMLAYSSVSQMGYIVLALGGDPPLAIVAAALHFFTHAVSKSQLFANAAAVEEQLGSLDMDRMGGIASSMPVTAGTSAVASLSVAGVPPLAGFWSKLLIVIALWRAGQYAFAVIAILASLLTLAYFLSLQRRVFFGQPAPERAGVREATAELLASAVALSAITVALGLAFPLVLDVLLGGGS